MHAHEPTVVERSWSAREEAGFHDMLHEWMSRSPWLAISAAAHLLLFVILYAMPWHLLQRPEETILTVLPAQAIEEILEDPVEDPPLPPEPLEPVEPLMQDANEAPAEAEAEVPAEVSGEESLFQSDDFVASAALPILGLGAGPGGKWDGRFGRGKGGGGGGRGFVPSIEIGLHWLRDHQSPEGMWEVEGFASRCGRAGRTGACSRAGAGPYDVGITGLALLAFLGDGHTTREGEHREVVARAVQWLREQQRDSSEGVHAGLIGPPIGKHFLYNHAIATLALCEAYAFSAKNPLLKRSAQDAVHFISRARGSRYDDVWRYDVPSVGDGDTSITGWMVFAMKAAEDAGLDVDPDGYRAALAFFDELTDPVTGRTGYTRESGAGSRSSRIEGVNSDCPREKGEALTAVTLLCRYFMGQDPATTPIMRKQAELLKRLPPAWDVAGKGNDMYYWYYGAYAMFQSGGEDWVVWRKRMEDAIVKTQAKEGCERGSWDPECAWGYAGGRVYSTAMMVLCLQTYYRYGRVLGGR